MASNPQDPELHKLLVMLQQQHQQELARSAAAAMPQVNNQCSAPTETPTANAGTLEKMLADYIGLSTVNGQSPAVGQQQQQLVTLSSVLSSVNHSLADVMMQQAMPLVSGQPNQQQLQHIVQKQQSQQVLPLISQPSSNQQGCLLPSLPAATDEKLTTTSPSSKGPVLDHIHMTLEQPTLAVLRTWNLKKLESHARQLEEFKQPIPIAVQLLLDDARQKEAKRQAKLVANRKSATVSRARKRRLIDDLIADNARLRRQAQILNYLPDPVIAISTRGKIKFCNVQMSRVFKHDVRDLEGANIRDILVPKSRGPVRRLIEDLAAAESLAAEGDDNSRESDENSEHKISGESSNNDKSSDHSFDVLEVNVGNDKVAGKGENLSDSDSSSKNDSKKVTGHIAPAKYSMAVAKSGLTPSKNESNQESQSSSSSDSDAGQRASSEDSGYMNESSSNKSSDDTSEGSSLLGNSSNKKGKRTHPVAPACIVQIICNDRTTIYCEITVSIRTRMHNDEDPELGITDLNPKSTEEGPAAKELLVCFRPIHKGEKAGEELRLPQRKSQSSHTIGKSQEAALHINSSGSEGKKLSATPSK